MLSYVEPLPFVSYDNVKFADSEKFLLHYLSRTATA